MGLGSCERALQFLCKLYHCSKGNTKDQGEKAVVSREGDCSSVGMIRASGIVTCTGRIMIRAGRVGE
jgi:hypothetical protein